jgi:hypothetical protein
MTKPRWHGFWQTNVPWALRPERNCLVWRWTSLGLHEANVVVRYRVAGDDPPRGCTFPSDVIPSSLGPATLSELVTFDWRLEDICIESCISIQLFSLLVSCLVFYFHLRVLRAFYQYYTIKLSPGYEVLKMPVCFKQYLILHSHSSVFVCKAIHNILIGCSG